ncbi:hypothetical protein L207DRAFT_584639 [Hyaloscypha variabilis F]|uniref:Uncharacterized protein n=1 Tax=Hyaloscypha variabilis (strain UAMH 11265 / GT02V1 / F) TaxID=1149755 RepID=A0A2J6RL64_HYAVF|nr:hypothetical protein L207DRAFT_584639 [Hyaloscypha variabilis F]
MPLRLRDEDLSWQLQKRDDSDCDDDSNNCSSSKKSKTRTTPTSTTSQTTSTPSTPAVGPGGITPPPVPSSDPTPPSGSPKPPQAPKQTSTSSTASTTSITSATSFTSSPISSTSSSTKKITSKSSSQTSLLANGVGILPTITQPKKQPAPTLPSADSGISSVNESSATVIKAASAIIAIEATAIIAAILLILYKLYLRKRQKHSPHGAKWAIGHTAQVPTPPYNDGSAGAGFLTPFPPSAVLRNGDGVWTGPGILQTTIFSSHSEHQSPNIQQPSDEQHSASNLPTLFSASYAENSFLTPNEKELAEIQNHEVREQMQHVVPAMHGQTVTFITSREVDQQRIMDASEIRRGTNPRDEKELLEMERELEALERKREAERVVTI